MSWVLSKRRLTLFTLSCSSSESVFMSSHIVAFVCVSEIGERQRYVLAFTLICTYFYFKLQSIYFCLCCFDTGFTLHMSPGRCDRKLCKYLKWLGAAHELHEEQDTFALVAAARAQVKWQAQVNLFNAFAYFSFIWFNWCPTMAHTTHIIKICVKFPLLNEQKCDLLHSFCPQSLSICCTRSSCVAESAGEFFFSFCLEGAKSLFNAITRTTIKTHLAQNSYRPHKFTFRMVSFHESFYGWPQFRVRDQAASVRCRCFFSLS